MGSGVASFFLILFMVIPVGFGILIIGSVIASELSYHRNKRKVVKEAEEILKQRGKKWK